LDWAVGSPVSEKNSVRFNYAKPVASASAGSSRCLFPNILGPAWLRFALGVRIMKHRSTWILAVLLMFAIGLAGYGFVRHGCDQAWRRSS
jgi:hypothetical protein